jgi:hypothetical protein
MATLKEHGTVVKQVKLSKIYENYSFTLKQVDQVLCLMSDGMVMQKTRCSYCNGNKPGYDGWKLAYHFKFTEKIFDYEIADQWVTQYGYKVVS